MSIVDGTVKLSVACLPGPVLAGYERVMTTRSDPRYAGYRFPAEVIATAVWLYFRFPLSLRMVEEMPSRLTRHPNCLMDRVHLSPPSGRSHISGKCGIAFLRSWSK